MARYPEKLLTDDETIVTEFNPHWRVLLPATAWLVLGVVVVVVATAVASIGGVLLIAAIVVGVAIVGALAVPKVVSWRFKIYVLTTERIIVRDGIVRRGGIEIPLENINNVLFNQGVMERLLGYGDVLVESAGTSGQSRLTDIPDPEAFQSQIYRVREERSMTMSGARNNTRDTAAQLKDLADLHAQGALTDDEYATQKSRLLDG